MLKYEPKVIENRGFNCVGSIEIVHFILIAKLQKKITP